ncbi:MAG: trifunctional histidinol dehydrogenase [Watsoniomyces obsoletus]|nr:MAG: trifunctional histidinol dehydrogenase [Watsoniomyces obsoletus]
MSSMRNALPRRNHRERAQPKERSKWGILEKHKDYTLRARDFNAKKARLKHLRQKASDRNPDEFYFGMINTQMAKDGTKIGDRGNKSLEMDVVRLLKTQDVGYLRVVIDRTRKDLEALEGEVHLSDMSSSTAATGMVGADRKGKHVVYVDSREEQRGFKPEEWFGTDKNGLGRTWNRPRIDITSGGMIKEENDENGKSNGDEDEDGEDQEHQGDEDEQTTRVEKWKARVEACRMKLKRLETAERELNLQRDRMSKTPTVGGVNKQGVKWRVRERKR